MKLKGSTAAELAQKESKGQIEKEISELLDMLNGTDWYVARFVETFKDVPTDIAANRAAARDRISLLRESL